MRVVCISGKACHGKDSVGIFLREELEAKGRTVLVAHYGDLIKYIAKMFFGWDGNKDEAGRSLLQWVGTELVCNKKPDYWVNFIRSILELVPNRWDYVLLPDTRRPNELEVLQEGGFDVFHLRVVRPQFESPLTEAQQGHPSETALDSSCPDAVVINDGSMQLLKARVHTVVDMLEAVDPMAEQHNLLRECYC